MNKGCTLDECLHALEIPQRLLEKPYLQPIYDDVDPSFLVRMVWRCYGGWWDGEFDHVLPAPRSAQAREWVEPVGGTGPVLERAQRLLAEGQYALACHLVEAAYHAAPTDPRVHQVRVEVYRAASQRQSSSMARKLLHHVALASEQLKRDLAAETLDASQVTQFSGGFGGWPPSRRKYCCRTSKVQELRAILRRQASQPIFPRSHAAPDWKPLAHNNSTIDSAQRVALGAIVFEHLTDRWIIAYGYKCLTKIAAF